MNCRQTAYTHPGNQVEFQRQLFILRLRSLSCSLYDRTIKVGTLRFHKKMTICIIILCTIIIFDRFLYCNVLLYIRTAAKTQHELHNFMRGRFAHHFADHDGGGSRVLMLCDSECSTFFAD